MTRDWSFFRLRRSRSRDGDGAGAGAADGWGTEAGRAVRDPGSVVAQAYEVGELMSTDATGEWHRVFHRGWRRELAMKSPPSVPRKGSAGDEALLDEARAWLEVPPHPHLLGCHFVHALDGRPRLFAEYAPGGDLAEALRGGRFTAVEEILDVAVQTAWGLEALHGAGRVHGDVRASAVVFAADGTAKLAGFGSPRREPADDMGQWSALLVEMFTGGRDLEAAVRQEPLPGRPTPPGAVVALLRACLDPDPAVRPAGMGVVAERLAALYEQELGRPYPRQGPPSAVPRADGWNNKALSLLALDEEERAEACWEQALRDDPRHADATFNLGVRHWRSGRITDDELMRRLEAVGQADAASGAPEARIPYLSGLAHLERGDAAASVARLTEAARLAPEDPEIASALEAAAAGAEAGHDTTLSARSDPGWIWSVAVTPDGGHALWGSEDGALRWWDVHAGRHLATLTGHTGPMWSVVLTPDGRHALSGSEDGTVRWWDLAARRCLRTLTGHTRAVRGVAVTPDGRYALSGSADGTVRRWDLRDGRCLATFTDEVAVLAVASTPDGRYAMAGGNKGLLRWWDLRRRQARTLPGHTDAVRSVAMTSDGRYALSVSKDSEVRWWDLEKGDCLRTFTEHAGTVCSVAVTPDGRIGVSGGLDRTVRCWDLTTGRCLRTIRHDYLVLGVTVTPDGRRVFSSASDRKVRAWSLTERSPAPWIPSRPGDAAELATRAREFRSRLDEARDLLRSGQVTGAAERLRQARAVPGHARDPELLRLWAQAGRRGRRTAFLDIRPVRTLDVPSGITSLALAPDGAHAVTAGWDNAVRWWDLTTGECPRELSGHTDAVTSLALTSDGRRALSGSADHTLRWWDLNTGECLRTLSGHADAVTSAALTSDGGHVLSAGADHTLRWWDLATGECVSVLTGHTGTVTSLALTPDGRHAVSGSADATMRWWDVNSGACLKSFPSHGCSVDAVAVAPDGRHALAGEDCGNMQWVRLEHGRTLTELNGHVGSVAAAAVTSDGGHALSAGLDGTLRWWDLGSGECRRLITVHGDEVCATTVTSDACHALSGSRDGTVVLWALDWDYTFSH